MDPARCETAIAILRSGAPVAQAIGFARCRLSGEILGTLFQAHGFQFPEKAEHYVEIHGVWTTGVDDLLDEALRAADPVSRPPA